MAKTDEEKRAARNASSRLRYWGGKRLKDVIRRKAQVQDWVETYDTVLEEKEAKVSKRRPQAAVTVEARAA